MNGGTRRCCSGPGNPSVNASNATRQPRRNPPPRPPRPSLPPLLRVKTRVVLAKITHPRLTMCAPNGTSSKHAVPHCFLTRRSGVNGGTRRCCSGPGNPSVNASNATRQPRRNPPPRPPRPSVPPLLRVKTRVVLAKSLPPASARCARRSEHPPPPLLPHCF